MRLRCILYIGYHYRLLGVKKALTQFADNVRLDQHAHLYSLVWAFSIPRHILQYLLSLLADNEGPDQPALMRCPQVNKGSFRALLIHMSR